MLCHCRQKQCNRRWIRKTSTVPFTYVAGELFHAGFEWMCLLDGNNDSCSSNNNSSSNKFLVP